MDLKTPPAEFDEAAYLAANRDVADAVLDGRFSSAWEHVLVYGYQEPRVALPTGIKLQVGDYWTNTIDTAIPPRHLRERVHGAPDAKSFHRVGAQISQDLDVVLAKYGDAVASRLKVLDFGCGCGRVLCHVKRRHPSWTIVARDIDAEAIAWCRTYLHTLGEFDTNDHWPPTSLESAAFDLIYAISVFTHLAEDMQLAWLDELRRLAKPGALLLLSVHSITPSAETVAEQVRKAARLPLCGSLHHALKLLKLALRVPKGFAYSIGEGTTGLPDFYQTALHSRAYVVDTWSRYFEIVEVIERAINNHQDLVVARRRV